MKYITLPAFFLFFSCTLILAQEWTKEDSIWLQNVLEGKETLEINEETKKAIEDGRLIAPPWLKDKEWELNKEFDNTGTPDSLRIRNVDPYSMPPGVFALYVLFIEQLDSTYQDMSITITEDERSFLKSLTPANSGYDFNHLLSMIFSTHYRQLMNNRKKMISYKYYYDVGGAVSPVRITERERKQLNQSVNSNRKSISVTSRNKAGGIDD